MNLCRGCECGQENGELRSGEVKNSKIENLIEDIQNLRWMTKPPDPTYSTLMDEIHWWYLWFTFIITIIIITIILVLVWLLLLLYIQFFYIYILKLNQNYIIKKDKNKIKL